MMTINEVSKLAGVSIRTLQYYDKIGLLHPSGYTDAGYRLYDDTDLECLQHILLFRELEFSLKDIKVIISSPDFNRSKALEQQVELLRLKKEHIENLINFALGIKMLGVKHMDFKAFDRSKLDEYSRQAKELYGNTPEYKEMEEKPKKRTEEDEKILATGCLNVGGRLVKYDKDHKITYISPVLRGLTSLRKSVKCINITAARPWCAHTG